MQETIHSKHSDIGMQAAIEEMLRGLNEGGIPIGSALIKDGTVISVGHNRRVQNGDPVTHAEIDCLRQAGRSPTGFKDTTLYSTLMPCYLCAGAVVQFGIKKVIAGESRTFPGAADFMRSHGVEVIDLDLPICSTTLGKFVQEHPELWLEDIGK